MEKDLKDDLIAFVDEAIFNLLKTENPALIQTIQALLEAGQSPTEIEAEIARRSGKTAARYVRHAAEHWKRVS